MHARRVHHQQPYAIAAIHSLLVAASRRRHRRGCVGRSKVKADDEKREANLQRQVRQEIDCTFHLCHVQIIFCVTDLRKHVLIIVFMFAYLRYDESKFTTQYTRLYNNGCIGDKESLLVDRVLLCKFQTTLFGEKSTGTDLRELIREAFASFDQDNTDVLYEKRLNYVYLHELLTKSKTH
jgi:hypothetical protein